MKKLNVLNNIDFVFNLRFLCKIHPPTRHIKYKLIDSAPSNKSVMANKLPITNLERLLRRFFFRLRFNSAKYIAR